MTMTAITITRPSLGPELDHKTLEELTEDEMTRILTERFALFLARGYDCESALILATHLELK